jgi:hypothetical protein
MPDLDRPDQKVFDLIESGSAKLVHEQLLRIWMGLGKKAFFRIRIWMVLSKKIFYRIRICKTVPQVIIPDLDGSQKNGL